MKIDGYPIISGSTLLQACTLSTSHVEVFAQFLVNPLSLQSPVKLVNVQAEVLLNMLKDNLRWYRQHQIMVLRKRKDVREHEFPKFPFLVPIKQWFDFV